MQYYSPYSQRTYQKQFFNQSCSLNEDRHLSETQSISEILNEFGVFINQKSQLCTQVQLKELSLPWTLQPFAQDTQTLEAETEIRRPSLNVKKNINKFKTIEQISCSTNQAITFHMLKSISMILIDNSQITQHIWLCNEFWINERNNNNLPFKVEKVFDQTIYQLLTFIESQKIEKKIDLQLWSCTQKKLAGIYKHYGFLLDGQVKKKCKSKRRFLKSIIVKNQKSGYIISCNLFKYFCHFFELSNIYICQEQDTKRKEFAQNLQLFVIKYLKDFILFLYLRHLKDQTISFLERNKL